MAKNLHFCLDTKGESPECKSCDLYNDSYESSFCKIMCEEIHRALGGFLKEFPIEDKEEIISESITGIIAGFCNFRGTHQAQFRLWVKNIIYRRYIDFIRIRKKDKQGVTEGQDVEERREIVKKTDRDTGEVEIEIKDEIDKDRDLLVDIKKFLSRIIREMIEAEKERCAKLIHFWAIKNWKVFLIKR